MQEISEAKHLKVNLNLKTKHNVRSLNQIVAGAIKLSQM